MAILATLLLTEYGPAAVGSDLNGLSHYPIADHTFFLYRLTSLMRYTFSTMLPIAGPVPVIVAFEGAAYASVLAFAAAVLALVLLILWIQRTTAVRARRYVQETDFVG